MVLVAERSRLHGNRQNKVKSVGNWSDPSFSQFGVTSSSLNKAAHVSAPESQRWLPSHKDMEVSNFYKTLLERRPLFHSGAVGPDPIFSLPFN